MLNHQKFRYDVLLKRNYVILFGVWMMISVGTNMVMHNMWPKIIEHHENAQSFQAYFFFRMPKVFWQQ
jgi:hypothetical protein